MKISWKLVGYGVGAFLVFLVATLPAEMILPRLHSRGIAAAGVSGSIWSGSAAAMQVGTINLGSTQWSMNFLPLFTGKLSANVRVKRDDGTVSAKVSSGFGKRSTISDLKGSLPVASLGGLGLPGGWLGDVRINLPNIELENGWPVRLEGSVDALNLVGPASQPTELGNFRVNFSNAKAQDSAQGGGVTGVLESAGEGPLDVQGTLQLMPNRVYVINAQVATTANAPANITKALQYLGPPDAQGRRPLSVSGSL
jgi:general secretion pathway protein N